MFPPRLPFLLGCLIVLVFSAISIAEDSKPAARPNIVFILADDLGWSDWSARKPEWFTTPHLDRLAQQGRTFTQGYAAAPICSASRAALLTGKTPARLGFEFVTKNKPGRQTIDAPLRTPEFTLNLPLDETTIAERLSAADYETAFIGKWHLNQHYKQYLGWSPTHGPAAQGFDVTREGFGSHPYSYWKTKSKRTFQPIDDGTYPEDDVTREAIRFLRQPRERPFFLMVSHYYVHTPVHTQLEWLFKQSRSRVPEEHPRRRELAHYLSMVTSLDELVGQVLTALDDEGMTDETLVVFTSDNGGHPEYAGNAPLRGSKWNLYEGGIRVPLVIRWPGVVAAGSVSHVPVHGCDLPVTFADVAEAKPLPNADGLSLRDRLASADNTFSERPLLWHFPYYHPETNFERAPRAIGVDDGITSQTRPHSALRQGRWKLLYFYENQNVELYDIATDPGEQRDRRLDEPEVARQMRQALFAELERVEARFPTRGEK